MFVICILIVILINILCVGLRYKGYYLIRWVLNGVWKNWNLFVWYVVENVSFVNLMFYIIIYVVLI